MEDFVLTGHLPNRRSYNTNLEDLAMLFVLEQPQFNVQIPLGILPEIIDEQPHIP